jgi:type IV conjugative transfer system protein TraE
MSQKQSQPYLDVVANAFKAKEAWRMATFVVSAVAIMLAFALVQNTRNTPVVLVPHDLASAGTRMKVETNGELRGTSQEYLANAALGDVSLILNFTPDNVQTQYKRFLNRLTEALYGEQKETMLGQAEQLRKDGITQSFNPTDVKVSTAGDRVDVSGTQIRYRAGTELQRANVTYSISYKVYKGYLHVSDLRQK